MKHYYHGVKLEGKRGTLLLTDEGMCFEKDGMSFLGGGSSVWPWKSVKQPYFSDDSCALHAMKVVFKEGEKLDPIILLFPNRREFQKMEHDVVEHGHLSPSPLKLTGIVWGGH